MSPPDELISMTDRIIDLHACKRAGDWPHMSSAAAGGVKVDTKSPARLHAGRYGHADQLLRRRHGPSLHSPLITAAVGPRHEATRAGCQSECGGATNRGHRDSEASVRGSVHERTGRDTDAL